MSKRLRNIFDQYKQQENHLTNSLLLVLNHNRNLLKSILKTYRINLSGKQINLLSQVAPRSVDNKSSVPDGYIYTEDYNFCIGIETKIVLNKLERKQLISHLEQLSQYNQSCLLVITPHEKEPNEITQLRKRHKNIRFVSWIDLVDLMVKVGPDKGKNPIGIYLFDEFISYIERCYQMTPFTGIKFREGYDLDLATHYIKRISENITPNIIKLYPECKNKRPKIGTSVGHPWESWYSTNQVQYALHPTMSIHPDHVRCIIILPNEGKAEWKRLRNVLEQEALNKEFRKNLEFILDKAPKGADSVLSFRQRHYIARVKPIIDAMSLINITTLLGLEKSKDNQIWWDLLLNIANTKNKYNYQLEIGYEMKYEKVEDLKNSKAIDIILKCYKNLKPIYNFLKIK